LRLLKLNTQPIFAYNRVKMAIYGAIDYAGDVGCNLDWNTHLFARSQLVAQAVAHDVTLFDTPHTDIRNLGRRLMSFTKPSVPQKMKFNTRNVC